MNKNVTPRRRANLEKLADYLEGLPRDYSHFEMSVYADHEGDHDFGGETFEEAMHDRPEETVQDCGTVACAVGHGPAAGIPFAQCHLRKEPRFNGEGYIYDLDWDSYATNFVPLRSSDWSWMFDSDWSGVDNHHWGAAARIRYYLDKGLPEHWNSFYTSPQKSDVELYKPYHIDNRQPVSA